MYDLFRVLWSPDLLDRAMIAVWSDRIALWLSKIQLDLSVLVLHVLGCLIGDHSIYFTSVYLIGTVSWSSIYFISVYLNRSLWFWNVPVSRNFVTMKCPVVDQWPWSFDQFHFLGFHCSTKCKINVDFSLLIGFHDRSPQFDSYCCSTITSSLTIVCLKFDLNLIFYDTVFFVEWLYFMIHLT